MKLKDEGPTGPLNAKEVKIMTKERIVWLREESKGEEWAPFRELLTECLDDIERLKEREAERKAIIDEALTDKIERLQRKLGRAVNILTDVTAILVVNASDFGEEEGS